MGLISYRCANLEHDSIINLEVSNYIQIAVALRSTEYTTIYSPKSRRPSNRRNVSLQRLGPHRIISPVLLLVYSGGNLVCRPASIQLKSGTKKENS